MSNDGKEILRSLFLALRLDINEELLNSIYGELAPQLLSRTERYSVEIKRDCSGNDTGKTSITISLVTDSNGRRPVGAGRPLTRQPKPRRRSKQQPDGVVETQTG